MDQKRAPKPPCLEDLRLKKTETSRRTSCDSLRNPHNSHFWTSSFSYLQITSTYMTNHPNEILNKRKPSPQGSRTPLQNPHTYMPQVLPAPPAASCLNDNSDTYQRCRSNEPLSSIHYGNTIWSCVICLMIFIPIV